MEKFYSRSQRVDESVEEFSDDLQKLLEKGFADLGSNARKEILAQRFWSGLRKEIREFMLSVNTDDFEECLKIAKRVEREINYRPFKTRSLFDEEVLALKERPAWSRERTGFGTSQTKPSVGKEVSWIKCFNCGGFGHVRRDCRVEFCTRCHGRVTPGGSCVCLKGSAPV